MTIKTESRHRIVAKTAAVLTVCAVILGATACGDDTRSSGIPADAPPTVWDKITAGIGENGTVGLDTALAAFSYAVAAVPGAVVPAGEPEKLPSGSGPVAWLLSHFDELSPEQKAAVADALSTEPVDAQVSPGGTAGKSAPVRLALRTVGCYGQTIPTQDSADAGPYRQLVNEMIPLVGSKLGGRLLTMKTYVTVEKRAKAGDISSAYTWIDPGSDCNANKGQICQIHLNPKGQALSGKNLRGVIAHEVTHCFIFEILGVHAYDLPAWIGEGMPAWAGEDIVGGSAMSQKWWKKYLTTPKGSLFKREYDAIGIYSHAQANGVDIWARAASILSAFDSEPAFSALVGDGEAILDSWASGLLRDKTRGSGWDATGPGITADKASPENLGNVGNAGSAQLKSGKVANNIAMVGLTADLVDISVDGHARFSLSDGANEVVHGRTTWCLRSDRCACPDIGTGGVRAVAAGSAMVAVTGGLKAGSVTITGRVLDCAKVDPCVVGSWASTDIRIIDTVTGVGKPLSGGAGVKLTIDGSGKTTLDHTGSTPLRTDVGGDVFGTKLDGVGTAMITTVDGVLTLVENDFATTVTSQQLTPFGAGITQKGSVALGTGKYSCDGASLALVSPFPLGEVRATYVKS